jgi:hypothetical protein
METAAAPSSDEYIGALDALRRRVRADQRTASLPLLIIGAVTFHYAVYRFVAPPIPWIYGAPLAFVAVWALQRRRESVVGLGAARDDTLVIAFVVWVGMHIPVAAAQSTIWYGGDRWALSAQLVAVGVGLALIGLRSRQPLVVGWALVYSLVGALGGHDLGLTRGSYITLVSLGLATVVVGIGAYLVERSSGT